MFVYQIPWSGWYPFAIVDWGNKSWGIMWKWGTGNWMEQVEQNFTICQACSWVVLCFKCNVWAFKWCKTWPFVAVSIEYMHRAEAAKWLPSTNGQEDWNVLEYDL